MRQRMGVPVPPVDHAEYDHTLAQVRGKLGPAFAAAWQTGLGLSRDQAVAYALEAPLAAERSA